MERIARTCLQDAVEISFADFWGGYLAGLERCTNRLDPLINELHAIPLGGTIVGRDCDVPEAYMEHIIPSLRKVTEDERYKRTDNLFDAAQNIDDMVCVSNGLGLLAATMIKICKDLRFISSGPETGLHEIILPAVQPGSSIMPGKINPVIPEFVIQLCFKVAGMDSMCQRSLENGELDLNIWESATVFAILESMELLETAANTLAIKCFDGIKVDEQRNQQNIRTIIPRLTELMKIHGYSAVSHVCSEAKGNLNSLRNKLKGNFGE